MVKTVAKKAKKKTGESQSARQRVMRKQLKQLTFGVTDTLSNVVLYLVYVTLNMPGGGGGPAGVHRAFNEADDLIADFNAAQIRKALVNLHQRGLIRTLKKEAALPEITKIGLKRLNNSFPFYDQKRVWDGSLYIITYDIPTKANTKRAIFRDNLIKLKATKLQDSAYLTPYNPREIIRELIDEFKIPGQILVSTLDPHDAFGETDIKGFLWDTYELEEVNDRYAIFISKHSRLQPKALSEKKIRLQVAFAYLSILQDDPQLPFDLLPDDYLGDEAYLLFRKLVFSR